MANALESKNYLSKAFAYEKGCNCLYTQITMFLPIEFIGTSPNSVVVGRSFPLKSTTKCLTYPDLGLGLQSIRVHCHFDSSGGRLFELNIIVVLNGLHYVECLKFLNLMSNIYK